MATDNYIKVHRPGNRAVEFFFDSRVRISAVSALNAAREYAQAITDVAQGEADASAERNKGTPQIVDGTPMRVWSHGVRGLGELHCVGGCDLCAHPARRREADPEEGDDEPALVVA